MRTIGNSIYDMILQSPAQMGSYGGGSLLSATFFGHDLARFEERNRVKRRKATGSPPRRLNLGKPSFYLDPPRKVTMQNAGKSPG